MRSLLEGGLFASLDAIFDSTSRMSAGNNSTTLDVNALNTPIPDTPYALAVTGRIFACRYEISAPGAIAGSSLMMGVQWSTGTPTGYFSKVRAGSASIGSPLVGTSNNRLAMPTLSAGPASVTDYNSTSSSPSLNVRLHAVVAYSSSLTVTLTPIMQSPSATYSINERTFDVRVIA